MKEPYQSFLKGENESFGVVFNEHHEVLLMIAFKYMRDSDEASDVVCDVYNKLLLMPIEKRQLHLPVEYDEFCFYLRRMVVNKSLDLSKQKSNQRRLLAEHFKKYNSQNISVEQELYEPELQKLMSHLLTPKELKVLGLHIEGYKNDEIAKQLGMSYFTVRNMISISKKKLKKQYKKYFQ